VSRNLEILLLAKQANLEISHQIGQRIQKGPRET